MSYDRIGGLLGLWFGGGLALAIPGIVVWALVGPNEMPPPLPATILIAPIVLFTLFGLGCAVVAVAMLFGEMMRQSWHLLRKERS